MNVSLYTMINIRIRKREQNSPTQNCARNVAYHTNSFFFFFYAHYKNYVTVYYPIFYDYILSRLHSTGKIGNPHCGINRAKLYARFSSPTYNFSNSTKFEEFFRARVTIHNKYKNFIARVLLIHIDIRSSAARRAVFLTLPSSSPSTL